jgi:hypothetical protein
MLPRSLVYILSLLVFLSTAGSRADDNVFKSPFSGRSISKQKFLRFRGMPVPRMVEEIKKENIRFVFLNKKFDPNLNDPRNGELTAQELKVFYAYAKVALNFFKENEVPNSNIEASYIAPWTHILLDGAKTYQYLPRPETGRIVLTVDPGEWPKFDSLLHEYGHVLFEENEPPIEAEGQKFSRMDTYEIWANHLSQEISKASEEQKNKPGAAADTRWGKSILQNTEWDLKTEGYLLQTEGDVYSLQLATYSDFNLTDKDAVAFLQPIITGASQLKALVEVRSNDENFKKIGRFSKEVRQSLLEPLKSCNQTLEAAHREVKKTESYLNRPEIAKLAKLVPKEEQEK